MEIQLFNDEQKAMTAKGMETDEQFFSRMWGASAELRYMTQPALAYKEDSPRIGQVSDKLGAYSVRVWIQALLTDYAVFCGTQLHLKDEQTAAIADMIMARYPNLRASELCLMFSMLKSGDIKVQSQYIDGRNIMQALKEFMVRRSAVMEEAQPQHEQPQQGKPSEGILALRDYNRQALKEGRQVDKALRIKADLLEWTDEAFLAYAKEHKVTEEGIL